MDPSKRTPYVRNHHSRGQSYPEKYFSEVFKNENLEVTAEHPVGRYRLDFAVLDRMVDIEVHGSQHYYDPKILASDERRRTKLCNLGWHVIEIKWSDYNGLSHNEKRVFVQELLAAVQARNVLAVPIKSTAGMTRHQKSRAAYPIISCEVCGLGTTNQRFCSHTCRRTVAMTVKVTASIEDILLFLNENGFNYSAAGRKFGCNGNSIKKRIAKVIKLLKKHNPAKHHPCKSCGADTTKKIFCSRAP